MRRGLFLLVAVGLAWPGVSSAQDDEGTPPRRFDAEVAYLSISLVSRSSPSFALGPEIGAGFLQQAVLAPSGDGLTGLAHVGLTSTTRLHPSVDLEVGVRAGLGELESVACAGCGFSGYYGVAIGFFAGNRTVRVGTRFLGGRIEGGTLMTWLPLALRVQF